MNTHPSPDGSAAGKLVVERIGDDRWAWRYLEPAAGLELHCNETFDSREAALDSAHRAYPDVPLPKEQAAEGESGGEMREPPALL